MPEEKQRRGPKPQEKKGRTEAAHLSPELVERIDKAVTASGRKKSFVIKTSIANGIGKFEADFCK